MTSVLRKVVLLFIALMLATLACDNDENSNEGSKKYWDYIAIGKQKLVKGAGSQASKAFKEALDLNEEGTAGHFGLLLSHTMEFTNLIDVIVSSLSNLNLDVGIVDRFASKPELNSGNPIHQYLYDHIVYQIEDNETLYYQTVRAPDFQFPLDRYVLEITDTTLLSLSGTFDRTDAHLIGAVSGLIDALLKIILSLDLRFDDRLLVIDFNATDMTAEIINLLQNLIDSQDYPTFLCLQDAGGVEYMQAAGVRIGDVFERMAWMFESLEAEEGPQADAPVTFDDKDHDGQYDMDSEALLIGDDIVLDPELASAIYGLCLDLAPVFWDGSPSDVDPEKPNPLRLSMFNDLLTAMDVLPLVVGPVVIDELPDWITIDVGSFFADPTSCGLRDIVELLLDVLSTD